MLEIEGFMQELWRRISLVEGVKYTSRNPSSPPKADMMPAIQMFDFPDSVVDHSQRGGYPMNKRLHRVAIEAFLAAKEDSTASKEIFDFLAKMKQQIFAGGSTLGKRCLEIRETEMSRVFRPKAGENIVGIGIVLNIVYIEDVSKIM